MSIHHQSEFEGMQKASEAVAGTLKEMREYAKPGMTTKDLDLYGAKRLSEFGAKSAPHATYGFPGWTCICVNNEFFHGIPSDRRILKEGDLVNIDVSAELDGFWADNGGSFVLGKDIHHHQTLVRVSKEILKKAIEHIRDGVRIADIGGLIEAEAKKNGFKVVKNYGGHGVGRALHQEPLDLLNYRDPFDKRVFRKNSVVAVEVFISTDSIYGTTLRDGWTVIGDKGGFMAQQEHTMIVTDEHPFILTDMNGILNE